jgi:hypothetical protein
MTVESYRAADPERLERILSHKGLSYAGAALVMPLLLAIVLFGTISFRAERYQAPTIARILSPPVRTAPEQVDFTQTAMLEPQQMDFEEFTDELQDRRTRDAGWLDEALVELPAGRGAETESPARQALDLEALPGAGEEAPDYEIPAVGDAGLFDPAGGITDAGGTAGGGGTRLRHAGGTESRGPTAAAAPTSDAAAFGGDAAAGAAVAGGGEAPVVVSRQEVSRQQGVGIATPASEEKRRLTAWIDAHPSPLRPAVQQALGYNAMKRDRTAAGTLQAPDGTVYRMYFLHRTENNLLRILLVADGRAYRIDLPDLYLEANHVQRGGVAYARQGSDNAAIIEVSLAAVSQIPAEVPELFAMVLGWLEAKGE